MENNLALESLFDGSSGFPLGGLISGIVYYTLNAGGKLADYYTSKNSNNRCYFHGLE